MYMTLCLAKVKILLQCMVLLLGISGILWDVMGSYLRYFVLFFIFIPPLYILECQQDNWIYSNSVGSLSELRMAIAYLGW
jgi:hypothetical protein